MTDQPVAKSYSGGSGQLTADTAYLLKSNCMLCVLFLQKSEGSELSVNIPMLTSQIASSLHYTWLAFLGI